MVLLQVNLLHHEGPGWDPWSLSLALLCSLSWTGGDSAPSVPCQHGCHLQPWPASQHDLLFINQCRRQSISQRRHGDPAPSHCHHQMGALVAKHSEPCNPCSPLSKEHLGEWAVVLLSPYQICPSSKC